MAHSINQYLQIFLEIERTMTRARRKRQRNQKYLLLLRQRQKMLTSGLFCCLFAAKLGNGPISMLNQASIGWPHAQKDYKHVKPGTDHLII